MMRHALAERAMIDSNGPIPLDAISIRDAFDLVYQALTPDWQELDKRQYGADPEVWRRREKARRLANEWLREKITLGHLFARVIDPDNGQVRQLDRHEWTSMGTFETGIDCNFVGPDDMFQSGPNTDIKGARQPAFFERNNFDGVLKQIASPPTTVSKGGRPSEYNWDDIRAFAIKQMKILGKPQKSNKRLPTIQQLIELIQNEFSRRDQYPSDTSLRPYIKKWIAEIDKD
jgi:hypothetical protein